MDESSLADFFSKELENNMYERESRETTMERVPYREEVAPQIQKK